MSQLIEILKKHGEAPLSMVDLMRAFGDGARVFRFHEMDGEDDEPVEVHSVMELVNGAYAYDQYLMVTSVHLPEDMQIPKEKRFYVSMMTDKTLPSGHPEGFMLAGPFLSHETALSLVDKVRIATIQNDSSCSFNSFGTVGVTVRHGAHPEGPINKLVGIEPEGL